MTQTTSFTPAASVSIAPDVVSATYAIPATDGANLDTLLTATNAPCWISFGAGAVVGSGVPGSIQVQPGWPILLTNSAATLAATANNSTVLSGVPATAAAGATVASIMTMQRGATLSVTRGTASARAVF